MKTISRPGGAGGRQGGKGSKSKCKNNVQARAHVITWQEEAFANQSINHGAGSSQARRGGRRRSPSPSGFICTFISAKSTEWVLLLPSNGEELAKNTSQKELHEIRAPRGDDDLAVRGCSSFAGVGVLGPLQAGQAEVGEKEGLQELSPPRPPSCAEHACSTSSHAKAREQARRGDLAKITAGKS